MTTNNDNSKHDELDMNNNDKMDNRNNPNSANEPNGNAKSSDPQATDGIQMAFDYQQPSQVTSHVVKTADASLSDSQAQQHTQHVALFTQLNRQDVSFYGTVKQPLIFRDTLLALFDVVSSDYRYVPKDRSAYTVFMQMRRANANKNLFAAQRDYFNWLLNNDPLAFCILDPIIQVHQNGVSFEVFSRDEGCYAQLTLTPELFDTQSPPILGTTSIDYSTALYEGISQIGDYQQTVLDIGHEAVSLSQTEAKTTTDADTVKALNKEDSNEGINKENSSNNGNSNGNNDKQIIEKRINVPKSWIRALLQVQSAGQLATDTIHLDPIALYNVLFELRMHADIKGKRRGLLIELQPQQAPVIILEPFNIAVTNQVSKDRFVYQGKQAKLIRLWGRRRLSLLKRLLPHTDSVSVSLLGQGMPSYWTLTGQGFRFTFAMTGFSQANWSQSLNFDLMLPKRPEHSSHEQLQPLLEYLADHPSRLDELNTALKDGSIKGSSSLSTQLISAAQQGFIRHDVATNTYYYRPLTQQPLDMSDFAHHNAAEKLAYDLIGREQNNRNSAVQKFTVENIPTKGIVIAADIHVSEDRRSYHSQLQLNEEGIVTKAECSCPQFMQHRLSQGVCAHLITLRLAYNDYDSSQANQGSWHETRVLSKRLTGSRAKSPPNGKHYLKPNSKPNLKPNSMAASATTANNSQDMAATSILDLSALAHPASPVDADKPAHLSQASHEQLSSNTTQIAMIYITIRHKKVMIEQVVNDKSTHQQFVYNQPKQAYEAYLQHIARFEAKGFIENQGV